MLPLIKHPLTKHPHIKEVEVEVLQLHEEEEGVENQTDNIIESRAVASDSIGHHGDSSQLIQFNHGIQDHHQDRHHHRHHRLQLTNSQDKKAKWARFFYLSFLCINFLYAIV